LGRGGTTSNDNISLDCVDERLDYDFFGGREKWAERFSEVRGWLSVLSDKYTRTQYRDRGYRYFRWLWDYGDEFAGKSLVELLDLQDRAVGRRERYAQLGKLEYFVNSVLKGTRAYKEQFISAVRSFYGCNYVELPRNGRFKVKADRDSIAGSLTREEFKQLLIRADMPYRAVYAVMLTGFMGRSQLDVFNHSESVRQQLLNGVHVVKCDQPARKRGKPFYDLIGGDGLKLTYEYIETERGRVGQGEAIFLNTLGRPLSLKGISRRFKELAADCGFIKLKTPKCNECGGETKKKVKNGKIHYICIRCGSDAPASEHKGLKSARYKVKAHECRDLSYSLWYRSGTPEKWMGDFFSGRTDKIDPNNYLKAMKYYPEWVQDTYLENISWLNVWSEEDPAKEERQTSQIKTLKMELKRELQEDLAEVYAMIEQLKKSKRPLKQT